MGSKISDMDLLALHARWRKGERAVSIADEVGLSISTLNHHWRRLGKSGNQRPTDEELQTLYARWDRRAAPVALAAEYGLKPATLLRYWRSLELPVTRVTGPPVEALKGLYDRWVDGEPSEALASEIGLKVDTLRYYWRREGWQICTKKRWTHQEAQETYERWQKGEPTAKIAEDLETSTNGLRAAWKRYLGVSLNNTKSWAPGEAETLWRGRVAGKSTKALAKKAGVTEGALRACWAQKLGKRIRGGKNRFWTHKELRETRARRKAGERTMDIASDIGVTANCLRAAWGRHFPDGAASAPNTRLHLTEEQADALWERCVKGETGKALAEEAGIKPSTLYHMWRRKGRSARKHYSGGRIDCVNLWGWRAKGVSWSEMCRRLDMPVDQPHRELLMQRLRRYCDRNHLPYPGRE